MPAGEWLLCRRPAWLEQGAFPGDLPAHSRRTRECFHAIRECAKPVVVAINGAAPGSGLAIVASGDVLIASAGEAQLAFKEKRAPVFKGR